MAYIGQNPIDAFRGLASYDTFTGDGSTTTFDLTKVAPDGGQNDITVVVNNVIQEPGVSKSYTLGVDDNGDYKRVTFNTAPEAADEIYVINPGRTTSVFQVSDNSIITSMLQDDAVTSAKIADNTIVNANINSSAAIAYSKLNLATSIANSDISSSAAIAYSKLNLATSITTSDLATGITTTHGLGSASTPSITFTGDTNTGIFSPTADTIAFTEGGEEAMRIDSSGNLYFNSGFGSAAVAYGCRAWVNFDSTSTISIIGSGNVSSITDDGVGNYTVNFATAMPSATYCAVLGGDNISGYGSAVLNTSSKTTSSVQVLLSDITNAGRDDNSVQVAIFR
jgi:hypothetical protein